MTPASRVGTKPNRTLLHICFEIIALLLFERIPLEPDITAQWIVHSGPKTARLRTLNAFNEARVALAINALTMNHRNKLFQRHESLAVSEAFVSNKSILL